MVTVNLDSDASSSGDNINKEDAESAESAESIEGGSSAAEARHPSQPFEPLCTKMAKAQSHRVNRDKLLSCQMSRCWCTIYTQLDDLLDQSSISCSSQDILYTKVWQRPNIGYGLTYRQGRPNFSTTKSPAPQHAMQETRAQCTSLLHASTHSVPRLMNLSNIRPMSFSANRQTKKPKNSAATRVLNSRPT